MAKEGKAGPGGVFEELWDAFDRLGPWGAAIRAAVGIGALVVVLVLLGIFAVKQCESPGPEASRSEAIAEPPIPGRRVLPPAERSRTLTGLRSLSPQRFEIARTAADVDSIELADAILAELREAHWKNESGVAILLPDGVRGVTVRMKKTSEAAVYFLNSLNRAGIQTVAFADVPAEKTYDVSIVVGPAP
jgi:hypothetical protein